MKKILFSLAACFCCLMANAQTDQPNPTISVNPIYAQKGGKATFTINLQGGRVGVYESFGFDIALPEGITTNQTSGFSTSWPLASTPEIGPDRAGIISSNYLQTADLDNLLSVELIVGEAVTSGTYTVTLNNITFGYGQVYQDIIDTYSFNVIVDDVLTLDENSYVVPKAAAQQDIKVLRSFTAGEWATLYLPFTMNSTKLKEAFGNDYQLAYISGVEPVLNDEGKATSISITFTKRDQQGATSAQANTPYIILPSKDVEGFFTAANVTMSSPTDANKTIVEKTEQVWDDDEEMYLDKKIEIASMTGTLKAGTVVPNGSLFINNNKFWYSVGKTKMKAFRAYFTFKDQLEGFNGDNVRFFVSDGVTQTEIQIPELMPNDGEYYNLNGLRVETPSKGIYIKNGKKVVVK